LAAEGALALTQRDAELGACLGADFIDG